MAPSATTACLYIIALLHGYSVLFGLNLQSQDTVDAALVIGKNICAVNAFDLVIASGKLALIVKRIAL